MILIYRGLDIVTAKASQREREMAKHHLLDILEPHQMFTVVDFRNRALKIIGNLTEQGKVPVIVGGTNYYLESIVYKILVEDMDDTEALLWDKSRRKRDIDDLEKDEHIEAKKVASASEIAIDDTPTTSDDKMMGNNSYVSVDETKSISRQEVQETVDHENNFTNDEIHAKLKAIDPVMAGRLHVNNRRKVLR
ncbi:unnamed protein product [Arctia plantaginis]|uniref:Uncharacterized protein n=1 Tax=Arctia plantaginis TaxID=874455 RepID=A0A8S1BIH2_ARCPL|nr:unnamed protein product [Arctia plantaginis]